MHNIFITPNVHIHMHTHTHTHFSGGPHQQQVQPPHQLGRIHAGGQGYCIEGPLSGTGSECPSNGGCTPRPPPFNITHTTGYGGCMLTCIFAHLSISSILSLSLLQIHNYVMYIVLISPMLTVAQDER